MPHTPGPTPVQEQLFPVRCDWCPNEVRARRLDVARFCSRKCRQAAFRLRRRRAAAGYASSLDRAATAPLRIAYADPPYPGMAHLYRGHPDYAGEVDHVELLAKLKTFDGWALSTSARALRNILPLCPPEARVCAWAKPHGVSSRTYGLHNAWEPVIVMQARRLRPGRPDRLIANPAQGGGETLIGRKPIAFCAWLFAALGMLPGDELADLFPGTGIVGRSWRELSLAAAARPVAQDLGDVSPVDPDDASDPHRVLTLEECEDAGLRFRFTGPVALPAPIDFGDASALQPPRQERRA